ncbi:2-C-methyl-D-erythritol 4-phosphate cytidylyltransferase [Candidatus Venteria ishoeyi]|uniref:2-C-methyl-D-erythritol 4-phosphate cytidylyltransferase n=1 Tax=Candidatus Venteria ishoeyi TaxID=1899563 RepID=UPI0025A4D93E|nr:2-C-methyl-D-erythritol 4-phosphate cytidylyltransferase [Candidatus Venteria ishoeyi]MDM8547333.1 2-C-methyl-D-erythritol 4-phosphate cytidylyltransferase [Candidatus Venteria ishoeyi]
MKQPRYWAVVPAAGIGKRMGADRPKQYLPLLEQPVIAHTLARLCAVEKITQVVVAVAPGDPWWSKLSLPEKVHAVDGGAERCFSVLNALDALQERAAADDWVLVHDAARPCIRHADIEHLINRLADHPVGGLLAMPVRDTMKRGDAENQVTATVNRENLWHALTPQMFRFAALRHALSHALDNQQLVTDEAQAMELVQATPVLVQGHSDNLKITHPQDLPLAAWYLSQQAKI